MKLANKANIGKRATLHPATDLWMKGDRYGEIIGIGNASEFRDTFTGELYQYRPYRVKMDKSNRTIRVHAENLMLQD